MSKRTVVDLAKQFNSTVNRSLIVAEQIKVLKVSPAKTKGMLTATISIDRHHGLTKAQIAEFQGRRYIDQRVDFDPELKVAEPEVEEKEAPVVARLEIPTPQPTVSAPEPKVDPDLGKDELDDESLDR